MNRSDESRRLGLHFDCSYEAVSSRKSLFNSAKGPGVPRRILVDDDDYVSDLEVAFRLCPFLTQL